MGCGAAKKGATDPAGKGKESKEVKEAKGPEDKKDAPNLAGGHADSFKFNKDGTLCKAGKKGEIAFYEEFNDKAGKYYPEMEILRPFCPVYHGIVEEGGKKWIKMQNATAGLTNVSFMDIKMGDKSYGPDATPEKIKSQEEKAKKTTSLEYGFRLTGMTVKDDKGANSFKLLKQYGELTYQQIPEFVEKLLKCNGKDKINVKACEYYIAKMKEILEIMEHKWSRLLIATSIFFVISNTDDKFDLKLIDFAHVHPCPPGERDTGFIKGVKHLITIFEGVLKKGK